MKEFLNTVKYNGRIYRQSNPNSMELDISGDEIVLELRTKKGRNGSRMTRKKLWDNLEAQVGEVASLKSKLPPSPMQKDILASFKLLSEKYNERIGI